MKSAHETIAGFISKHGVDWNDFCFYCKDAGFSEEELNIHDSRSLEILEGYVDARDHAEL